MNRPVRIANCSGFYGDRFSAAREMLDGPIDVLTGDYLAELTMLILWKARRRDESLGYATTFLRQMQDVLGTCLERGVKVVANAGGLNPEGLAARITELSPAARVAYLTGDDLAPAIKDLQAEGHEFTNLDTGVPLAQAELPVVTANAYLGGWGIAAALRAGADVVICGRVTDASLVTGPAAWWHGWRRDDWDALAGAVAAGHVIECGPQATGGNYSFLDEITDRRYPGFPIAEVAADGSSVITKHDGTGGLVSTGTVTAQLLYEIGEPAYLNPNVVAHFDTIGLEQAGPDRVALTGTRGSPPTDSLKVALNMLGGYRNTMTMVITGLDVEEKAEHARNLLLRAAPRVRGSRRPAAAIRPPGRPGQRAGRRPPARHRQGPRRTEGGPGLLRRDHRTRPGRIRRLPHHHPARRGERLRGLLARPHPGAPGHAAGTSAGRKHQAVRHHAMIPVPRARARPAPAPRPPPQGPAGRGPARPAVRRAVRRQGRQRQRGPVGGQPRRLRLAAPAPDRRGVP